MVVFLYKFLKLIIQKLVKKFKFLHNLTFSSNKKFKVFRKVFMCVYGIFVGYIFWKLVMQQIAFPLKWTSYLILSSMIFCAFGCSISIQFRCITALMLVTFFGSSGRNFLKTIIFTLVLTGPLQNILLNSEEVVRVFSCASYLTYNLTKTKVDLMTKPFKNVLYGMDKNLSSIQNNFKEIHSIVNPIFREIEGEDGKNSSKV